MGQCHQYVRSLRFSLLKPQLTHSTLVQPAVVDVPSSDLSSQLLEPPDLGHGATSTSSLGLLQDFSSLLQFPMPAGPDLSTSFGALPYSDDSSFSWENFDWTNITEFNNLFPPNSTQWPSPSTSSSGPTPPDNLFESLPLSQYSNASEQPLSQLDSSVPPSSLLTFGSGTFTEDVDYMCSFASWGV